MNRDATVYVVDDDPAMRKSLAFLIESVSLKVETFSTGQEFLDRYDGGRPCCLVLDVRMPGMSGLELQEALKAKGIAIPLIFITGYGEVPTAVRAMQSGAVGFMEKPFSDQVLLERIELAIARDREVSEVQERTAEVLSRVARLTPREREVMNLVVNGLPNKQIAARLGLSQKTIEVHRAHVMTKMESDSLAELVRLAQVAEAATEQR